VTIWENNVYCRSSIELPPGYKDCRACYETIMIDACDNACEMFALVIQLWSFTLRTIAVYVAVWSHLYLASHLVQRDITMPEHWTAHDPVSTMSTWTTWEISMRWLLLMLAMLANVRKRSIVFTWPLVWNQLNAGYCSLPFVVILSLTIKASWYLHTKF